MWHGAACNIEQSLCSYDTSRAAANTGLIGLSHCLFAFQVANGMSLVRRTMHLRRCFPLERARFSSCGAVKVPLGLDGHT